MSEPKCRCGHEPLAHRRTRHGVRGCRVPDCGCARFEEAQPGAAGPVLDVAAMLGEVQADVDREAELTAQLAEARAEIERLNQHEAIRAQVIRERNAERAEAEKLRALLEHAEQHARDLQEQGVVPADERVYDTHVRHLCPICGGRYREIHTHPCGPLKPVRVVITFIEE